MAAQPPAQAECCACFEIVSDRDGLYCKLTEAEAAAHFVCGECLNGCVLAANDVAGFRVHGGGVPCPGRTSAEAADLLCPAPVWTMHELRRHLQPATLCDLFQTSLAAVEAVEGEKHAMDAAAVSATHNSKTAAALNSITSAALSALDESAKLRTYATAIDEHVLWLRCPRCNAPFADFEGCDTIECGASTCKQYFCAICFHQGTSAGVQAHVRVANHHKLDIETFYGGMVGFKEHHAARQRIDVAALVATLPESETFKARLLLELEGLIGPLAGLPTDSHQLIERLRKGFARNDNVYAQLVVNALVKLHERAPFILTSSAAVLMCNVLQRNMHFELTKRQCMQLLATALQEGPLDTAMILRIDRTVTSLLGSGPVSPAVAALACKLLRLTSGRLRMAGTALPDLLWNLEMVSTVTVRHNSADAVVTEGLHALSQLLRCRSAAAASAPPVLFDALTAVLQQSISKPSGAEQQRAA